MVIEDQLYGSYELEDVLQDLIQSKPVQRLKGIHQGGASYLVNPKWNVTRYEHSLGVMLLVRKLGGSLEEQIAALLHDVSHTAFSHVVDYVLEHEGEDYHENIYEQFVKHSDISVILRKYGFHYQEILLDDSRWTLLEQPAPELCADRVDYTLRDMTQYGHITLHEAHTFLEHLTVVGGKVYLNDLSVGEWFVETYYKEVIDFFMDPLNIYGNDQLAKALKLALQKEIISSEDFLKEDEELLEQVRSSRDLEVISLIEKLQPSANAISDTKNYDIHRKGKVRLIDPSVLYEGELIRASKLSNQIELMNREAHKKSVAGAYVKVLTK
ncbi:HD domain-containing protein [Alkalibacillus haloalkaliphilus]|uniref:HD domain-containing protein n=1 Tax=Alkalibacillus haloalkaliphilus TaxID=94136 RepID=UPI0029365525|nr:HD domain-containing protein [Alkalibacillus haloalkaliphilus]MDV2581930.1 HD domain-containing protein [Alkalibacillus haloalkaliphilus]